MNANKLLLASILAILATSSTSAQNPNRMPVGDPRPEASLADQLAELRTKVLRLEAALRDRALMGSRKMGIGKKATRKKGPQESSSMKREGDSGKGMQRMGGGKMMKGRSRSKGMGLRGSMPMSKGGMRMGMMGMMGKMGEMGESTIRVTSDLPGFPGISHLYHIGASGFFLEHADHLKLEASQRGALASLKEKTTLGHATLERRIAQAEQDLWELTSADAPDAQKIEAKLRIIADLGLKQRMDFIRAVGKAAELLTDDQRKVLLGEPSAANSIK